MDIPVYIFTGFLEGGKTTMLRDTLVDPEFNKSGPTLVLLCEQGEEEIFDGEQGEKLAKRDDIFVKTIEDAEQINRVQLNAWVKEHKIRQVLVEMNGMWKLEAVCGQFPRSWVLAQQITLMDANTILMYNQNMRERVVDHLRDCDMAIFNRVPMDADVMPFHKLVRSFSRRAPIVYDYADGHCEFDEIEDPLPFDVNAPVVTIADDDFALFFRDIMEDPDDEEAMWNPAYVGKTVQFKAQVAVLGDTPDCFGAGRRVMECCADDIAFLGFVSRYPLVSTLKARSWVTVTAKVTVENHAFHNGEGVVLIVEKLDGATAPDEEVCMF